MSGNVIDDRGCKRYNLNYLNIISGFNLSCINQLLVFVWLQFTTLTHSLKYTAKIKFRTCRQNEGKFYVRQEQNLMQSSRSPPQFLPAISDPLPSASAATWCGGNKTMFQVFPSYDKPRQIIFAIKGRKTKISHILYVYVIYLEMLFG